MSETPDREAASRRDPADRTPSRDGEETAGLHSQSRPGEGLDGFDRHSEPDVPGAALGSDPGSGGDARTNGSEEDEGVVARIRDLV